MNATLPAPTPAPGVDTDWASVWALTVGITAFAIAQGLTYPLFSLLLAARGVSDGVIGVHAGAFMLGLGMSILALPALSRALAPGAVMVLGLAAASVMLVGFMVTDSLWLWLILRFGLGFSVSIIYVLSEAWLNTAAADRVRGRVAGLFGASMSGGFALGPLGIPLFGIEDGLAFAVCAVIIASVAILFGLILRRTRVRPAPARLADLPGFVMAAPFLLVLVLVFALIDATSLAMAPVALIARGLDQTGAALVISVLSIGMIVAQPGVGWLLDHYDRWRVAAGCMGTASAAFMGLTLLDAADPVFWGLAGLAGGAFFGIYTSALALLGQEHRGTLLLAGSSAFTLAYALGGVIGPASTGAVMALDVNAAFWLPALVAGLGALAVLLAKR